MFLHLYDSKASVYYASGLLLWVFITLISCKLFRRIELGSVCLSLRSFLCLCPCVRLSVRPSVCWLVRPCASVCPSVRPASDLFVGVSLSVCPSVCFCVCLSVSLSVRPSVCLSLSVLLSVCLSVCVCPSVCPSVCLSVFLSVCRLPVHSSVYVCPSIRLSIRLQNQTKTLKLQSERGLNEESFCRILCPCLAKCEWFLIYFYLSWLLLSTMRLFAKAIQVTKIT